MVIPDISKRTVFSNGRPKTSICLKYNGGHTLPMNILGDRALWKKAQKNEKKNIISDIKKSKNPKIRPP